jgi:hypothetical protein
MKQMDGINKSSTDASISTRVTRSDDSIQKDDKQECGNVIEVKETYNIDEILSDKDTEESRLMIERCGRVQEHTPVQSGQQRRFFFPDSSKQQSDEVKRKAAMEFWVENTAKNTPVHGMSYDESNGHPEDVMECDDFSHDYVHCIFCGTKIKCTSSVHFTEHLRTSCSIVRDSHKKEQVSNLIHNTFLRANNLLNLSDQDNFESLTNGEHNKEEKIFWSLKK